MKYILTFLLSVNIVLGGGSYYCNWDKFDAEYNKALYLNSSINIICKNFEFINNNNSIINNNNSIINNNNITNYCRTHPTNNIMKSLPKNNKDRDTYCDWDDLRNIRNINNVLYKDYINPICLMCNNISNNIYKFNLIDQSYINNGVSICNSLKKKSKSYIIIIIFSIGPLVILPIFLFFLFFYIMKRSKEYVFS